MDSSLRDTTINSIARWKRRLEGTSTPGELALIGREAEQLRGLALNRGENALADQLGRLAALTGAPAAVVSDAVRGLAELVGMQAPVAVQPPAARPFGGTHLVGAPGEPAPGAAGVQRGSGAPPPPLGGGRASPVPGAPPALSIAAPPPLMLSRLGVPSMVQPPMIVDAEAPAVAGRSPSRPPEVEIRPAVKQPSRPPGLAGTMLSGGVPGGEEPKVAVAPSSVPQPRPPSGAPPPPVQASNATALPPSIGPAVRPPKLLEGTFLGFRAFRGQPRAGGGASNALPPGEAKKGLLGLQKLTPLAVNAPRMRAPSYPPVDRPRRRISSQPPEPQTRIDVPRWFYVVAAAIGGLAAVVVVVIVLKSGSSTHDPKPLPTAPPIGSSGASTRSASSIASPEPVPIPSPGAHETPQMRELLEAQRRLTLSCEKDPSTCDRWTLQAIEVAKRPAPPMPPPPPPPDEPLPGWLKIYKMPEQFPVRDEPGLRALFDYTSKNIVGRAAFQSKLFVCSRYRDIFDSTLIRYGAPHWLTAVVYQESACNRLATSQVGARGLWQFMPESARAYGLRVVDGDIDERLNPVKSTDAAVHFLTDLYQELGSWDLALAAYNMGPYGVMGRIAQVGGHAGFWELSHGGLLPDETASYVPAIESYAIVLANLPALKLMSNGEPAESTAEVIVKPGTRLSQIAMAASTSAVRIHELNPEFLRDIMPQDETEARVPDSEATRAQAILDSWSPSDRRDTCVPPEFDWGKEQFETSRYAKKCSQSDPGAAPQ